MSSPAVDGKVSSFVSLEKVGDVFAWTAIRWALRGGPDQACSIARPAAPDSRRRL